MINFVVMSDISMKTKWILNILVVYNHLNQLSTEDVLRVVKAIVHGKYFLALQVVHFTQTIAVTDERWKETSARMATTPFARSNFIHI